MRPFPCSLRWILGIGATLWISLSPPAQGNSISMRTVEGEVVSTSHSQAEGDLEVVSVRLRSSTGPETEILLAPEAVCDQIGLQVEPGDHLKARVFVSEEGPAIVQKIQNFTRGTMVRLRTLHRTPLWTSVGEWRGGPMRSTYGPHRNRGGGGTGRGGW